jgi:hypothetical protein
VTWWAKVQVRWPLNSEDPWFKAPDTAWRDWRSALPGLEGTVRKAGIMKGGKVLWVRNRDVWEEKRPKKLAEWEGCG